MRKKYKILKNDSIEYKVGLETVTLYRIKALKDFDGVCRGDIGGYIQDESCLSQFGDCWVYDDSKVMTGSIVRDDAILSGMSILRDKSLIENSARVIQQSVVCEGSCICDNATVSNMSHVMNGSMICDNISIDNCSEICDAFIYGSGAIIDTHIHLPRNIEITLSHCEIIMRGCILNKDDYTAISIYGEDMIIYANKDNYSTVSIRGIPKGDYVSVMKVINNDERFDKRLIDVIKTMFNDNKKYRLLLDHTCVDEECGDILYQIQALTDFGEIKIGDLGGFVKSHNNLSQEGKCWITKDVRLCGNSAVKDDAYITGDCNITGNSIIDGQTHIIADNVEIKNNAHITDAVIYACDSRIQGFSKISGNVTIKSCAVSDGAVIGSEDCENEIVLENMLVDANACIKSPNDFVKYIRGNTIITAIRSSFAECVLIYNVTTGDGSHSNTMTKTEFIKYANDNLDDDIRDDYLDFIKLAERAMK